MVFTVGMFTACKKNKDNTTTTSKPNNQQGSSAADGVIDNVNDFINNKIGGGSTKRVTTYNLPCGVVSLDSSTVSDGYKVYKMQYGSQTPSIGGDTLTNVYEIGKTYDGNYDYQTELITNFKWSNCGTTYAGPYVLKAAHARMNLTIPLVTPAYIDVEGGYYWNYSNVQSTPTLVNDCTTNAYKITTVVSTATSSTYQLY